MEQFFTEVKQFFRNDKPPPIVLRSAEGVHEEQLAIYQMRAQYES